MGLDISCLLILERLRNVLGEDVASFFLGLTFLGEESVLLFAAAGIFWCVHKKYGEFLLFSLVFSRGLGRLLKAVFCVPRPWMRAPELIPYEDALDGATGYSFPSGHSTNAMAFWGGAAVCLRNRKWISLILLSIVFLVGFSRLYLGVHTPQDVLGGFLCGGLVLCGVGWFFQRLEKNPRADWILWTAGTFLATTLLILAFFRDVAPIFSPEGKQLLHPNEVRSGLIKSAGAIFGLINGWMLERRYIRLNVQAGSICEKCIRFLTGAALLIFLLMFSKKFFSLFFEKRWAVFFANLLILLFVTAIYPAIARRLPGGAALKPND